MRVFRLIATAVFTSVIFLVLLLVPLHAESSEPCIPAVGTTELICPVEPDIITRITVYRGSSVEVLEIDPELYPVTILPTLMQVVTVEHQIPIPVIEPIEVEVPITTVQQVFTEVPVTDVQIVASEVPVTRVVTFEVEVPVTRTKILTVPVPYTVTEYVTVPHEIIIDRVITVPHDIVLTKIVTVEVKSEPPEITADDVTPVVTAEATPNIVPVAEIELQQGTWWETDFLPFWQEWWWAVLFVVLLIVIIAIAAIIRRRRRHHHP